jgi:hypothetical protein
MDSIIRNVREIDSRERQALEHVLGQPLMEDQRVIIQVETFPAQLKADETPATELPAWCDVYAGLTDEEIDEIEKIALSRADMTRQRGVARIT